jgi:hypothetical protein
VKGCIDFSKRTYLFLAALTLLFSCVKESKPDDILSRAEMVKALEELYIAEEKVNTLALARDSARKIFSVVETMAFENAALTDTTFKKSFDYYMERPAELELIYTALVDTLHLKEEHLPFRPDQQ